jgi:hypothetical protein
MIQLFNDAGLHAHSMSTLPKSSLAKIAWYQQFWKGRCWYQADGVRGRVSLVAQAG